MQKLHQEVKVRARWPRALGFTTVMVAGAMRELWPGQVETRAKDADYIIEDPIEMLPPGWAAA
jgi:hypothetical protein